MNYRKVIAFFSASLVSIYAIYRFKNAQKHNEADLRTTIAEIVKNPNQAALQKLAALEKEFDAGHANYYWRLVCEMYLANESVKVAFEKTVKSTDPAFYKSVTQSLAHLEQYQKFGHPSYP